MSTKPDVSHPYAEARAEICLTFDNLGEAGEIELGLWPADRPTGNHPSVNSALSSILQVLEKHGAAATFFVEGWNADVYGEVLRNLEQAGHEVALHGWRHESWSVLDSAEAEALVRRSLKAFQRADLRCVGLRPPGGSLPNGAEAMLCSLGFEHVSPAGEIAGLVDGIASLPFRWQAVDALYFEPLMNGLRARILGGEDVASVEAWRGALSELIERAATTAERASVIFHPYLMLDRPERLEVLDGFIAECRAHPGVRLVRSRDAARALLTKNKSVPETVG